MCYYFQCGHAVQVMFSSLLVKFFLKTMRVTFPSFTDSGLVLHHSAIQC